MTNKHKPVVDPDSFDEGTHGLEVHERAVRGSEEAAVVLGIAPETTNFALKAGDNRAALLCKAGK